MKNISNVKTELISLKNTIGRTTKVTEDLKSCFPEDFNKILSLAYFLLLEENRPVYRFRKWAATHVHPLKTGISSQRISELFAGITEEQKMRFFRLQSKRRSEREYLAYDITSISSYSQLLKQVKYGH